MFERETFTRDVTDSEQRINEEIEIAYEDVREQFIDEICEMGGFDEDTDDNVIDDFVYDNVDEILDKFCDNDDDIIDRFYEGGLAQYISDFADEYSYEDYVSDFYEQEAVEDYYFGR